MSITALKQRLQAIGQPQARAVSLGLAAELLAQARGLPTCPFLPVATSAGVPDDWLMPTRRALAGEAVECVDFATLPVRHLGELYEQLLAQDRNGRKSSGSFYTPQTIVDYIVERTLGASTQRLLDVQVLDPAMGTGHFLVAAMRHLAERLIHAEGGRWGNDSLVPRRAMHYVATHCLWGVDLDPLAVQLARASLWLEIGLPEEDFSPLLERLRCADALLDENLSRQSFDYIVGNPPYGGLLDATARKELVRVLPQMKHNADTAIGFLERSLQWLAPGGRCGLIVPKPLTYSFAWRAMRKFLGRRIEHVADVSRAWPEVKLEQVIVIFGAEQKNDTYSTAWLQGRDFSQPVRLDWRLAEQFDTLPCALETDELRLLGELRLAKETVGEVVRTWRGRPLQAQLQPAGEVPIAGGRDLARWRVRGFSGYLMPTQLGGAAESFAAPKLVFQNIIAHIVRPRPHIRLIGAYDDGGLITLDTVNNLTPREPGLPLRALLALLHSQLVNWFIYSVIYNKAIRTMHFDQYFLDKIPLPLGHARLWPALEALAIEAEANERAIAELERELAVVLREELGIAPHAKALAGWLAGKKDIRAYGGAVLSRSERTTMKARPLLAQREMIQRNIDTAVNSAYGLTNHPASSN